MVGTRSNPHRKLDKEFLPSQAPGNIKKHRAKHMAPSSSSLPPSPSEPVLVYGHPLPSTPPITPVISLTGRPPGKLITRQNRPPCLDYGIFRRLMYSGSLFCSPCDKWEEQLHLKCHLRNKARAKKYACKCEHTSFVEPASVNALSNITFDNNRSLFANKANSMPHPLPAKYKEYNPSVFLCNSYSDSTSSGIKSQFNNKSWCSPVATSYSPAIEEEGDCKLPSLKNTEPHKEQINKVPPLTKHAQLHSCVNQTESEPVFEESMRANASSEDEKAITSLCNHQCIRNSRIPLSHYENDDKEVSPVPFIAFASPAEQGIASANDDNANDDSANPPSTLHLTPTTDSQTFLHL